MAPNTNKLKFKTKNRSNKLNLVFDESKRREFLTGFHKRKLQRKKKAQEELEQQLKEERKRLKTEAKESYKKLVVSHRPVPEIQHLLEQSYEDENVTVRVVELSTNDIAKQNNWIGVNQPIYEESDPESVEDTDDATSEIPGMELKKRSNISKKENVPEFKKEKDLKKALKKQATKNVQKSKIFQMKNKIESRKQKKKSRQLKSERIKVYDKKNKHKKKGNATRNR